MTRRIAERVASAAQRLRPRTACSSPRVWPKLWTGRRRYRPGRRRPLPSTATSNFGIVLKYHEDLDRVHDVGLATLLEGLTDA